MLNGDGVCPGNGPVLYFNPIETLDHKNAGEVNYAVVVLNRPIEVSECRMTELWNRAQIRVLVDGGADRWLQFCRSAAPDTHFADPDLLTGDMDSILPDTLQHYTGAVGGPRIIRTPDQDQTDYTKALVCLVTESKKRQLHLDSVFTVTESSGRLDHIFANINTLYQARLILLHTPVFHLGGDSLCWLLPPGQHLIRGVSGMQHWCSLLPVGGPAAHVSTRGLQWDLKDEPLQFGATISTSNVFSGGDSVRVETEGELVWCMGLGSCPAR